ncbi:beta-ketoacyl-[acyl-carrier-protein] synthase family protein [Subtercola endophyticus]|uniref:beta-ketoacyl-[acyl-carrier-protein] synthase family protein n=1 Tax=Subtercola endophyticus TaxID=2895559 RepID=UPI001E5A90AD|nr:beta-ketoacyl-[acyl-carrier-protein] synthase family protein [Subtercola endophyticus]UFS59182.1 beta-ketoacyl-[acyl-carrier-protein] synthase family protein [Subtercola endophyticus]
MKPLLNRTVAVTGIGVVTPAGVGVDAFWQSLFEPGSDEAVRRVDEGSLNVRRVMTHKAAKNSDVNVHFAVVAADEALRDAGLLADARGEGPAESDEQALVDTVDLDRAAVSMGTGIGGIQTFAAQADVLRDRGERLVSPHTVPMVMPNAAAGALSIRFGMRGTATTVTTACAAGTDAIANGARLIAQGVADVVLAGGTDSSLTPVCIAGFGNMRALSKSGISRPFDRDRDGLAASEGCGMLVLEPLDQALARGAHVYMTIEGAASTADAYHVTAPAPEGRGAERTMRLALDDAGLKPEDITHINAHGTSTGLNDAAESQAVSRLFGASRPVLTSIKGVTGHSFGAAGAIEAVAVALTIANSTVPPTAGLVNQDEAIDLDIPTEARPWQPGPVLSNSFGFGGHNGSLVFVPVLV